MGKAYSTKATSYNEEIDIYISVEVDNVNPLEVKADIDQIVEFLKQKYCKQAKQKPIGTFRKMLEHITKPKI